MDLRLQAELYRRGLLGNYVKVEEAVRWADDVINAMERPPIEIIELALAGGRNRQDAARTLEPLTAGIAADDLIPQTVALMREMLDRDESRAPAVAWSAYDLSLSRLLPPKADLPALYSVWYEFDPEEAQWASSRVDATRYLRDTLAKLAQALQAAV